MLNPLLAEEPAIRLGHRCQRVMLVRIERDILHRLRLLSAAPTAGVLVSARRIPCAQEAAQRFHTIASWGRAPTCSGMKAKSWARLILTVSRRHRSAFDWCREPAIPS